MHYSVRGHIFVLFAAAAESVGEYLIHNAALYPIGSRHILIKDGKLEQLAVIKNACSRSATLHISSVAVYHQRKIVMMQSGVLRVEVTGEHVAVCCAVGYLERYKTFFFTRTEHYESRVCNVPFLRKTQRKRAGLKLSYRSERALVVQIKAVEYRSIH